MVKYIVKRILFFIPTLIIISVLAFVLSILAPGDQVQMALGAKDSSAGQSAEKLATEMAYRDKAQEMGKDLPVFYLGFSSAAIPRDLHEYIRKSEKKVLASLCRQYGNWPQIKLYYDFIDEVDTKTFSFPDQEENKQPYIKIRTLCSELQTLSVHNEILKKLDELNGIAANVKNTEVTGAIDNLIARYKTVQNEAKPVRRFIPVVRWYGFKNQYHRWLSGFMIGDFGESYLDSRPVSSKVKDAIPITFSLNLIAILIAYLVSIPLGVFSSVNKDTSADRAISIGSFILYSIPVFWTGIMLVNFFTNDYYNMHLFPNPVDGLGDTYGLGFGQKVQVWLPRIVLPIFCMVYGSFAYLSRQMRGGMLNVLNQDYIRTARAKGLSKKVVVWKHAFRNSLIPIITLFAYLFPAAIAGSVVIEVIFNINGMGKLMFDAIVARDYPVVFTITMFSAILTLIGTLVADILYAVVDPRISYS